jgi:glyceraldehyde-3-phosphate dehydrogenase (NADP+)
MQNFAKNLLSKKTILANIMVDEIAKTLSDAVSEVERTYEYIQDTIKEMDIMISQPLSYSKQQTNSNKTAVFIREPVGVVLAISPFNYPVNLSITKIAPALLAGNTVVFKPATQGSFVGNEMVKIFYESGFDYDVIQIVTGKGSEIGDYLVSSKRANMISFTGGTEVGLRISALSPNTPIVLELGGKDAAIVLDDILVNEKNPEKVNEQIIGVAKSIVKGAFSYSGQRCTAVKRVLASNKVLQKLTPVLLSEISKIKYGSPKDDVMVSYLINKSSKDYVMSLINDSVSKGGRIEVGGYDEKLAMIKPTLISNVNSNHRIALEEQFGPVLPIIEVNSIDEIIKQVNASNYGLQCSVFSKDEKNINYLVNRLDVGSVNINCPPARGPDIFPYIGVKDSGFGVQGVREAIISMTKYKGIVKDEPSWLK